MPAVRYTPEDAARTLGLTPELVREMSKGFGPSRLAADGCFTALGWYSLRGLALARGVRVRTRP